MCGDRNLLQDMKPGLQRTNWKSGHCVLSTVVTFLYLFIVQGLVCSGVMATEAGFFQSVFYPGSRRLQLDGPIFSRKQ